MARTRKRIGPAFPLIATNGARSGEDAARMILAGASAVEYCSAVMTGGFGVLGEAIDSLSAYLSRQGVTAAHLTGRAADQIKTYAGLPARADYWRGFVPQPTLAA